MSEIKLGKNGDYWQARWYDSKNKLKRKNIGRIGELTKTQAKAKIVRMQKDFAITPAKADADKAPTLTEWEERYFNIRTDLAEGTVYLHKRTFALLKEKFGKNTRMDRITADAAMEWAANIKGSENWKRSMVRNAKVIWSWAMKAKRVFESPFADIKSSVVKVDKDWDFITDKDLDKIFAACPNDGWRCLFALTRWAGLRRNEAERLKWADIDWDAHTLNVKTKNQVENNKQKRRIVPIVPMLYKMLLTCFESSTGSPQIVNIKLTNVNRDANVIVIRAKMRCYKKTFHTLRKNCESEWMEHYPVMDVCGWMGHSPSVAMEHYKKSTAQLMQQVTGQIDSNEAEAMEIARQILDLEPQQKKQVKALLQNMTVEKEEAEKA